MLCMKSFAQAPLHMFSSLFVDGICMPSCILVLNLSLGPVHVHPCFFIFFYFFAISTIIFIKANAVQQIIKANAVQQINF